MSENKLVKIIGDVPTDMRPSITNLQLFSVLMWLEINYIIKTTLEEIIGDAPKEMTPSLIITTYSPYLGGWRSPKYRFRGIHRRRP